MRYFSGFCLKEESELFDEFTCKSDFSVCGFSYGAIKAFEYTLRCKERIDKLQLFSPAFFMDKDEKFKKLQTLYFKKDSNAYCNNFLENVTYPSNVVIKNYFSRGSLEELKELLYYNWNEEDLKILSERGVEIEVYLGELDKIIESHHGKDFFQPYSTIYTIKNVGHILK
jgi:hypothetical protein